MKKSIIFCLFLFLVAGGLMAQEGVKVGFRASPLLSFGSVVDSAKAEIPGLTSKAGLGFSFGLMTNFGFGETVSLHTGLHVQTRGFTSSSSGGGITADQKVNVTTLQVPIQLKMRSPEIGTGIYIVGMFGGAAELNLGNKITTSVTGFPEVVTKDPDDINLLSFSFVPGAGVDWEFDWGTLFMGVSYHWGLSNILNRDNEGDPRAKMNTVALDLGYYF